MKKKKITAVQIAPYKRPNPEKILKKLKLDTKHEYTIHYFFKPHIGGIMYNLSKKEVKNG
tara:strand:+ start:164 stop:343 length:180 start_codon:yes stop_codon:yes gene_type:complete